MASVGRLSLWLNSACVFSDSNLRLFVSRDGTTALSGIRLGNRWAPPPPSSLPVSTLALTLVLPLVTVDPSVPAGCPQADMSLWWSRAIKQWPAGELVLLVFPPSLGWPEAASGETWSICTLREASSSLLVCSPTGLFPPRANATPVARGRRRLRSGAQLELRMFLDLALQTCKTSTGPQLNWFSVPTLLSEDKRKKLRWIFSSYFVLVFFNLRAVWRVRLFLKAETNVTNILFLNRHGQWN